MAIVNPQRNAIEAVLTEYKPKGSKIKMDPGSRSGRLYFVEDRPVRLVCISIPRSIGRQEIVAVFCSNPKVPSLLNNNFHVPLPDCDAAVLLTLDAENRLVALLEQVDFDETRIRFRATGQVAKYSPIF